MENKITKSDMEKIKEYIRKLSYKEIEELYIGLKEEFAMSRGN